MGAGAAGIAWQKANLSYVRSTLQRKKKRLQSCLGLRFRNKRVDPPLRLLNYLLNDAARIKLIARADLDVEYISERPRVEYDRPSETLKGGVDVENI